MWGFGSFNRGYILVQLLLLLPDSFFNYSISVEPESSQINYLQDLIQNVIKEKPADILLLLKRRQDHNCVLKEFNPNYPMPTLRLDESTIINVKDLFNSESIALVCMSELADSMLLTSLAKDLHRMRESRIIIWLQDIQSSLTAFLDIITDQSNNHNFLSLIVLYSNSTDVNGSIVAYRLQPFPSPTLQRILNMFDEAIFVKTWLNFNGKTAVILPDLMPPHSLLATDIRTGQQKFYGCYDRLIDEFAKKYNIRLRLKRPISEQMVMVMSIFSLIFSCFFNANLSTLLTKQPHNKQIDSFEELRKSGMTVIFDERSVNYIKADIDEEYFIKVVPNIEIMPTKQRQTLLLSLNTSYAHHLYTTMWETVDQFQKLKKQNVLCKFQGLTHDKFSRGDDYAETDQNRHPDFQS
ncbi:hypothetical protein ACLKA6_016600 [Drosophila palustris]